MKLWEIKQAAQPGTLELYVYGDVQGDSFDMWSGQKKESETSANHFRAELAKYPDTKQINIYINSCGGSVFEGTAIYSQLKRHPAQKTVYIDGFACSVASVIAMAGDKVIMPKNTMMLIHNAWNLAVGNAKQLRKAADDLDAIMEGNRQAYLQKAGDKLAEDKLIEMLEDETWLTADMCLKYGLCDEVSGQDVDLTEANEMLKKVNQTAERQVSYNKAIAAQLKEMLETQKPPVQAAPPADQTPPAPPAPPAPPSENKLQKLFSALVTGGKD